MMRRIGLVPLLAVLLVACGGTEAVTDVDPQAFLSKAAEAGVVVLDVRTPAEFAEGHVDGAVNIDVEDAGFSDAIAGLDKATTYAVYCHSGRRSGIATSTMADSGFTSLYNLVGGIADLAAAGATIVAG